MTKRDTADAMGELKRIVELLEMIADRLETIDEKLDELSLSEAPDEFDSVEAIIRPATKPAPGPH